MAVMQTFLLTFPQIDPELFAIDIGGFHLALRWYALAYIAGILIGWQLAVALVARGRLWPSGQAPMSKAQVEDLLTWVILGVVLGGRIGYVLFYKPSYYSANPAEILVVWQGGMAFHGGFVGVVIAAWIYASRQGIPKMQVADMLACVVAPGLLLGRLANFINAELWGRASDLPWAMKFPTLCTDPAYQGCAVAGEWFFYGDEVARHPSQLYQAGLEGLVLALVMLWLAFRAGGLRRSGLALGVFLAGYGAARFIVEFVREPDRHFVTLDNPVGFAIGSGNVGLTMGQLLSLPMIALGLYFVIRARRTAV